LKSLLIGLTGPIGAGKSTVAACWKELGAGLVEGDAMGRLALETDDHLRRALVSRFGNDVISSTGEIIRANLANVAFQSADNQRDLTRITFPALYTLARREMTGLKASHGVVVFDAALIYEWDIAGDFDKIVVVTAPRSILVRNSAGRLRITHEEAEERLDRQLPVVEKTSRADIVISNDGSLEELAAKAVDVWKLLNN